MNDLLPAFKGEVQLMEKGLEFKKDISIERWVELGKCLKQMEKAVQWWIGDWLNYGERKYGEMYTQALEATDYEYNTLRDLKSISKSVEMSRRRDNLSFGHHQNVRSLEPEEQTKYLKEAEDNNLSVAKLRDKIKEDNLPVIEGCKHKNVREVQIVTCLDCGQKIKNIM